MATAVDHKPSRIPRPTLVGLVLSLGSPVLLGLTLRPAQVETELTRWIVLTLVEDWGLALLLLALVLWWERRSLRSIGLTGMSGRDVLWGVVGFLVGALAFAITTPLMQALGLGTTGAGIARLAQAPVALRVVIALTAGITEEVLFRGYPIERLTELTGRLGLGAAIAYAVFVLLHLPFWGMGGTVQIGVWSLVVTLLYVRRRNLPACMLMHILNDLYAFILLPALFAPYLPTS